MPDSMRLLLLSPSLPGEEPVIWVGEAPRRQPPLTPPTTTTNDRPLSFSALIMHAHGWRHLSQRFPQQADGRLPHSSENESAGRTNGRFSFFFFWIETDLCWDAYDRVRRNRKLSLSLLIYSFAHFSSSLFYCCCLLTVLRFQSRLGKLSVGRKR